MSNGHVVPAQVWWYGCGNCGCIKAMYRAAPALCFSCCMELAVEHVAKCEEGGRQCCCPDREEAREGICETDGCLEPYLFDEDDDDTQARCFDCWARDQIDAKMRPEEEDEEDSEDSEDSAEEDDDAAARLEAEEEEEQFDYMNSLHG